MEEEKKKVTEEASLFREIEIKNYRKKEHNSGKVELIKQLFAGYL